MSGFLPEGLANWALGGGQGDNDDQLAASSDNNEARAAPISEQDMQDGVYDLSLDTVDESCVGRV